MVYIAAAGWTNWSGSVVATPATLLRPTSEGELARAIAAADKVRVAGAGHSFMPLCDTAGLLISLDDMPGELTISADRTRATASAGWSLKRLTAALWDEGLSLPNQGDVNPQSLAGSIATGTHGTGRTLGSLSTLVRSFRLILADGSIVAASPAENPELFEAQRLSLGLFGVAVEIEFDVIPAFHLEERIEKRRFDEIAECFDDLAAGHRHVEFWWFPHADSVILKTLDLVDPCDPPRQRSDMSEKGFRRMCDIGAAVPMLVPYLQRSAMKAPMRGRRKGPAHVIFPSDRTVRFEEMEYELPEANGMAALKEVVGWIRKKRLPVSFPFEYRTVAGDDIWLSPMNAGPCASISMHQYAKMPWRGMFAEAEAVLRAHGGRPHWAKRHTLTRDDVDALYPLAERFRAVRRAHDPGGKFLNAHLAELFA
ncbi:D-arabinono-1,4-lactone oxidase [Sphingomonas sp. SUN019]|uniref:D-arabinono-1,4-lactone oxidase n=1 Tax=Sphingomonas sp. SUN019 TaxID=2937788 RepID=UPI002164AD6E|nr:D-arabinono-1,4-lactone oxidase [Sphingomonas sp. SUN019]